MTGEIQPSSSGGPTSTNKPEQPKKSLREKVFTAGKWIFRAVAVGRGLGKLWDWMF